MAGRFSIYKYVKLDGKGWRYARAAFHSNGKIKPNIVIVKGASGKATEEKHAEGAYFLNFNNTWIPVGADANILDARDTKTVAIDFRLRPDGAHADTLNPHLEIDRGSHFSSLGSGARCNFGVRYLDKRKAGQVNALPWLE